METVKGVRFLAASLLMLTGIIHLAMAALAMGLAMMPIAVFGVLYVVTGLGLFAGKRLFNYLGVIIPLVGACVGTYSCIAMGPETIMLLLIAIDIAVILCCCYLILHKKSS